MGIHFRGWLVTHPTGWLANCFDAFQLWPWGVHGWRSVGNKRCEVESLRKNWHLFEKRLRFFQMCSQALAFRHRFFGTCSHTGHIQPFPWVSKGLGFKLKFIYFWQWHSGQDNICSLPPTTTTWICVVFVCNGIIAANTRISRENDHFFLQTSAFHGSKTSQKITPMESLYFFQKDPLFSCKLHKIMKDPPHSCQTPPCHSQATMTRHVRDCNVLQAAWYKEMHQKFGLDLLITGRKRDGH